MLRRCETFDLFRNFFDNNHLRFAWGPKMGDIRSNPLILGEFVLLNEIRRQAGYLYLLVFGLI